MKEDIAKAWVEDLRNPENKQAGEVLFDGFTRFCCLGRLCVLTGHELSRDEDLDLYVDGEFHDAETAPPSVMQAAGLRSQIGASNDDAPLIVGGEAYSSLAEANDDGRTFAEIADAIERDWRRL